ncbi:Rha family transcriptional regulator [Brevibacillus brevis]|uniref:Rha family transcriptional regulator n=1 Tax=Brevibacillus brevis TaxID=1393 RepID=UPI0037C8EB44
MSKLILNPEYGLYERNGQAFCSSRQVAEEFEKRHDNVLQDVRSLDCSAEFRLLNFQESSYKNDQNKKQPEYLMTKDGFTFLAMGYRGAKAARFKEAYIRRFNEMAAFIQSLQATKIEFPAFTDAIMSAHQEPKHYHFSNEINMIYRIVLGMDAKAFREQNGLAKGEVIKPYLSLAQIQAIETLQRVDIGLIVAIPQYDQRKQMLAQYHERMKLKWIA